MRNRGQESTEPGVIPRNPLGSKVDYKIGYNYRTNVLTLLAGENARRLRQTKAISFHLTRNKTGIQ